VTDIETFIRGIPKAELHVHLEGCLEPELMFALAERNGLTLRWPSPDTLRAAYNYNGLSDFLALYFEGCRVLRTERDFHDLTSLYLRRAAADNVRHAEMFIGPQGFTTTGVPLEALMSGVLGAMDDADISTGLLISVHRHRTEEEALAVLDSVMPWADRIAGFGMGGAELGNPPSKFVRYFAACRDRGFPVTVHAGEEGPPAYVREAIELLHVDRIDHGNACMQDAALRDELVRRDVPLTVCPLSNIRLGVEASLAAYPLRAMLAAGLNVSVHSDDPPYFGGYITDNLLACQAALGLTRTDILTLVRNGFRAAFLPPEKRSFYLDQLKD
jgi:adenosine deaminase